MGEIITIETSNKKWVRRLRGLNAFVKQDVMLTEEAGKMGNL